MQQRDLEDPRSSAGWCSHREWRVSSETTPSTRRAIADHMEGGPDGDALTRGFAHGYRLMAADLEDPITEWVREVQARN